jgi:putative Holliday junction resolvase
VKAIGLDYGERRIGVAAGDPLGLTAQPLARIERTSVAADMARIADIARRRSADTVVVGLPLEMDGSMGPQARRVRRFALRLEREIGLPVVLWDERLSTVEAERSLLDAGERRENRREVRDSVAAALILQSYLDAQRLEESP